MITMLRGYCCCRIEGGPNAEDEVWVFQDGWTWRENENLETSLSAESG